MHTIYEEKMCHNNTNSIHLPGAFEPYIKARHMGAEDG